MRVHAFARWYGLLLCLVFLGQHVGAHGADVLLPRANVKDVLVVEKTTWAACAATGILSYVEGRWTTHSPVDTALANRHPLRLALFDDVVVAALFDGGLWRYVDAGWKPVETTDPDCPRHCTDIVRWRGDLWCTLGDRLGYFGTRPTLETVIPPLPRERGPVATCLAADGPQRPLYVGTSIHQILSYDGVSWNSVDFSGRVRGKFIRSMALDGSVLWFGTFGGLYAYEAPELRHVSLPDLIGSPLITSVALHGGVIWVGTWGHGVFQKTTSGWIRHLRGTNRTRTFVNTLRAFDGDVHACTTRGLHRLRHRTTTGATTGADATTVGPPLSQPAYPLSSYTPR